jgi:hypothetical protein
MSSSLDKLKALTSKLEEKLEQKKTQTDKTRKTETESVKTPVTQIVVPVKRSAAKRIKKAESENVRQENIDRVRELYEKLKISEKSPDFENIFIYKAMNLSGIGLKEEDFGEVRKGKYIQVIAITYEPDKNGKKKAKNISLGYFGKAETLDPVKKNQVIEFVLRWRYEKAFQNLEHYRMLLDKVRPKESLF